jgi:hypothetical protein
VLLALLPYGGTIALYWLTSADLFREGRGAAPSNWNWRLVAPIVVGGLTPLALAARSDVGGSDRGWLLSATGVAILFALICMTLLRNDERFFGLQLEVVIKRKKIGRLPRWRVLVAGGTLLLCYGAAVNVVAAAA